MLNEQTITLILVLISLSTLIGMFIYANKRFQDLTYELEETQANKEHIEREADVDDSNQNTN